MIFAMYLVVAEQQGADWQTLSGTIQNDILKEFIAQKEYIFPPRPSMRLITDVFAFCAQRSAALEHDLGERRITSAKPARRPRRSWPSRCATASSMSSAASTPGSTSTSFVPRLSFFFNAHSDFFEEIAQLPRRAQDLGARDARSLSAPRTSDRGSCASTRRRPASRCTAQQPYNNVVRTAAAGAGRRARRHELAPHQLARRGAWRCRPRRPPRSRFARSRSSRTRAVCRRRRRPARRVLLRRGADVGAGARRPRVSSSASMRWAAWWRPSSRASPARDRRERLPVPAGSRAWRAGDRRRERRTWRPTSRRVEILYIDEAAGDAQTARLKHSRTTRDHAAVSAALHRIRSAAAGPDNLMPRSSTPCAATPRSVRCATCCARCGGVGGAGSHLSAKWKCWAQVQSAKRRVHKIRVVIAKPGLDGHDRGADSDCARCRDARHGGDLHRAAPDARADRQRRAAGGRRRHRAVDPLRRAQPHLPARDGACSTRQGLDDVLVVVGGSFPTWTSRA